MAYREVLRLEIAEVVPLAGWEQPAQHSIGDGSVPGHCPDLAAAREAGVIQEEDQLSRLAGIGRSGPRQSEGPIEDLLGPWADQVYRWLNVDRLQITRIRLAARGCQVAYSSLYRFVARRNWRGRTRSTVRMGESVPCRWTSGAWASSTTRRPDAAARCGRCAPLPSQLPLAHLQPEVGGRNRRTGGGWAWRCP